MVQLCRRWWHCPILCSTHGFQENLLLSQIDLFYLIFLLFRIFRCSVLWKNPWDGATGHITRTISFQYKNPSLYGKIVVFAKCKLEHFAKELSFYARNFTVLASGRFYVKVDSDRSLWTQILQNLGICMLNGICTKSERELEIMRSFN